MKKFILVVFIGMVLALNVYGLATDLVQSINEAKAESEVATVVYVE